MGEVLSEVRTQTNQDGPSVKSRDGAPRWFERKIDGKVFRLNDFAVV